MGLRIENEKVFTAAHKLILQWYNQGKIDGMRIDHIDGLRDPMQYLHRLRKSAPKAWLIAEKILLGDEKLPLDSARRRHDWLRFSQ